MLTICHVIIFVLLNQESFGFFSLACFHKLPDKILQTFAINACRYWSVLVVYCVDIIRLNPFTIENCGFWPSGIVVACVCPAVRPSVTKFVRAITHYPFKLGSANLDHRCKTPWLRSLLFWGWLTLAFKVKFNFKVKIYPCLSLWFCPRHKSPRILVRISNFGQKMHLSTVKVSIDFGIYWASSSVSVSISNLLFSTVLTCIYDADPTVRVRGGNRSVLCRSQIMRLC